MAIPLAQQPRQHAQKSRFAAAGFTDQAEGFTFSMAKLAAETAVFSPKLTRSWLTSTSAIVVLLPRLRTVERRQHLAKRPGVRAAGPERARVGMGCLRQLARRHFINVLTLIHHQHAVAVFRDERQVVAD